MYQIGNLPTDAPAWLVAELRKLQEAATAPADSVVLKTLYKVPARIYDGMIVKADGTTWNPGGGAGAYMYRGSAWRLLG